MYSARRRRPSRRKLFVEALESRRVMATLQLAFYNDANINNTREASENLLAGPTINYFVDLDASGTRSIGDITGSTNTGVATLVSPILGPGAFRVFVDSAGSSIAGSGPQIALVIDPLSVTTVPDIGAYRMGEIRGNKFNDHNADGIKQASDETLAGASFNLTNLGADGLPGGGDDGAPVTVTTDAAGNFTFANLLAGTYQLSEPANPTLKTTTAAFSNFVVNASGQVFTGVSGAVLDSLQTEVLRPELQRGDFRLGEIYGYAFIDANANGVDNAESRVTSGVTVTLRGAGPDNAFGTADDLPNVVTTPDPVSGLYSFLNLDFGRYQALVTPPPSVTRTTAVPAVASINDSGRVFAPTAGFVTPGARQTTPIARPDLAIGLFRAAEIRGHKFNDHNADGTKQSTDEGLAGVRFTLTNLGPDGVIGGGDDGTPVVATTNASGDFAFTNLSIGTYQLVEEANANIKTTTAAFTNFVVDASGQLFVFSTTSGVPDVYQTRVVRPELRRGNFRLGEIFGYVFVDRNQNGLDDGETRSMPGVTVLLTWAGPDNDFNTAADNTTRTLTPDPVTGVYSATQLEFGRYRLSEQLPTDVVRTTALPGVHVINDSGLILAANTSLATPDVRQQPVLVRSELALGAFRLAEVYGYTFVDRNGNGVDNADPRVTPGVSILLTWAGLDGDFATTGDNTTQTLTPNAVTGLYSAKSLRSGNYRLQEQLPTDVIRTTQPMGNFTVNDSGLIFAATTALATPDVRQLPVIVKPELALGVFRLGVVRGYAFGDISGDGVDSGAEPRGDTALSVPPEAQELRVTVQLQTSAGANVGAPVITDAAGVYTFSGLTAGTYQVVVTAISPSRKLTTTRTITNLLVSSGSVYQAVAGLVTPLDAYQSSTVNSALAVGSAKKAVIKGYVYLDRDSSGTPGASAQEPGMAGFTVSLVGAGLDDTFGSADDLTFPDILTTSTGLYEFSVDARNSLGGLDAAPDILPGQFRLTITEPLHYTRGAGVTNGTETRTITGVRLNDVLLGTGITSTLVLNADQTTKTDTKLNFGVERLAAIQGVTFNDVNANGVKDAAEATVGGQTIRLEGPLGFTPRSLTTGPNGVFLFDDLPAGTYTVSPILKSLVVNGVTQDTQGRTKKYATVIASRNSIYVAPGLDPREAFEKANSSVPAVERILLAPTTDLEQGIVQLSKLEGTVFIDANANGVQEATEAGQSGVQVALRRIDGGYQQDELATERTVSSDSTGKYTFYVWPGTYDIAELAPAGFETTTPRQRFTEYGLVNVESGVDKFAKPRWSFAASLDAVGANNDLVVVDEFFDRLSADKVGGVRIYRNVGTASVQFQQIAFAANARPSYAVAAQLDSDPDLEIIVTTSGTPTLPLVAPYDKAWGDVFILDLQGGSYKVVDPLSGNVITVPSSVGNTPKTVTSALGGDGPRHVSVATINGSVYLAIANERNYDDPSNIYVTNYHDVSLAKQTAPNSLKFSKVRTIDVSTASVSANVISTVFGKFDGTNVSLAVPQYGLGRIEFFNPLTGAKVLTPITGLQKPSHLLAGNFVQLPTDTQAFDDLVVTESGGTAVDLFPQVNGKIGAKIVVGNIDRPTFASAVDVDRDGDLDLAVASGGTGAVSLFYNQVPGLPAGASPKFVNVPNLNIKTKTAVAGSQDSSIMQVAFGDFNGDAYPDLVATPFTGGVSVHPSSMTSAGNWQSLQTIKPATNGAPLSDKRNAISTPVTPATSVVPLKSASNLAVLYPTSSKLSNSGLATVPVDFTIKELVSTTTLVSLGNVRTAPAPLMLSTSLRPAAAAFDLTGNGQVEPLDALLVINSLNIRPDGELGVLDVNRDGALTPLDALLVINEINTSGALGSSIDTVAAQSMFQAAVARLSATSALPQLWAPLIDMTVETDDLPDGVLSWVVGNTLVVDRNASGRGWFIDGTPESDSEFTEGRSVAGVDLLSVLAHEIGHLLGLEDQLAGDEGEIMHAELRSGERRLDASAVDRWIHELQI